MRKHFWSSAHLYKIILLYLIFKWISREFNCLLIRSHLAHVCIVSICIESIMIPDGKWNFRLASLDERRKRNTTDKRTRWNLISREHSERCTRSCLDSNDIVDLALDLLHSSSHGVYKDHKRGLRLWQEAIKRNGVFFFNILLFIYFLNIWEAKYNN